MIFKDRSDAGLRLAKALKEYRGTDVVVLAIPRGGVEVGVRVAEHLGCAFSIVVSRKLPFPDNPESGFGAIAEDGSVYLHPDASYWIDPREMDAIIAEQKREIQRRIAILRGNRNLPEITGKTVILVDDGIAMGSTMRASIELCRKKRAARVIAAAPVASPRAAGSLRGVADNVVTLQEPADFMAVADYYANWYDVPDEEVISIMEDLQEGNMESGVE